MWDRFYCVCLAVTFVYLDSFWYWQLHVFQLAILVVLLCVSAVQPASLKPDCLYYMQDVDSSFMLFVLFLTP